MTDKQMTLRARLALTDCEHALTDYEAGANTPFQRPRWVAAITLLRTVGLVLKDVDRPAADVATQGRMDAAWKQLKATKPEPRIFHDFIDAERYNVVHLYDPSARVNVTIRLGGVSTGGGSNLAGPATNEFVMWKGFFAGRDPRELYREAIAFWRTYLDAIDKPTICNGQPFELKEWAARLAAELKRGREADGVV